MSQPRAGSPRGPDTTVTSPCTSAAAMAYPEKSSQRSSVSSVSSHVRLSQSSSKSYSLLGAMEQHVSTQQENPSRQGRQGAMSVPKALPQLNRQGCSSWRFGQGELKCAQTQQLMGKGLAYGQEPWQIQAGTPERREEMQEEGSWISSHPRHGWAQVSPGVSPTASQSTGCTYPVAAPPISPSPEKGSWSPPLPSPSQAPAGSLVLEPR